MRILIMILFLAEMFMSGCASVARLPISTGQVPEVSGELWSGRVGLDLSSSVPVTTVNDITSSPPTRDSIGVGEEDPLDEIVGVSAFAGTRMDVALGLLRRLDIYFTGAFGARYMLLGEPGKTGWRSTLFVGYYSVGSGNSTVIGSDEFASNTNMTGFEFGGSIGNRMDELSLAYVTLASRGGDARIRVVRNGVEQQVYEDTFDHYLMTFGFMFGQKWYLKVEASANFVSWKGPDNSGNTIEDDGTGFGGTLGFGYQW